MNDTQLNDNRRLYIKLLHSGLFKVYQEAFVNATGLPLVLHFPGATDEEIPLKSAHESPFCSMLKRKITCEQCRILRGRLAEQTLEKTRTVECFAGMRETAVPVRVGKNTVALLETGQIFFKKPTKKGFAPIARALIDEGRGAAEVENLQKAYLKTKVVNKERYRSMITLLNAFSLQLADLANRIVLEHKAAEPAIVRRGKEFILDNLDNLLRLDDVAKHTNVSTYYFCKIFKQATGITFTEFVNRQRIERAKRLLLDPEVRVTEVAYDVGFQSLSQFNRSFLKIVGAPPTEYRRRLNGKQQLTAA